MQDCAPASPTCLDLVFFCHCCTVIAQPDFRCFIKGTWFKIFLKCHLEIGYPIAIKTWIFCAVTSFHIYIPVSFLVYLIDLVPACGSYNFTAVNTFSN